MTDQQIIDSLSERLELSNRRIDDLSARVEQLLKIVLDVMGDHDE